MSRRANDNVIKSDVTRGAREQHKNADVLIQKQWELCFNSESAVEMKKGDV